VYSNPYESPSALATGEAETRTSESTVVQRSSRDFGLASLIMAAALLIIAPLAMILAVQIWKYADRTPGVVVLHAWLARIGCAVILAVGGASVWLGVAGVRHAKRERVAAILPLAGVVLGIVALLAWVIASIAVLNTTESLVRLFA
jgi:heme/copper-type cytochrome/quinol oxidase subunit 3